MPSPSRRFLTVPSSEPSTPHRRRKSAGDTSDFVVQTPHRYFLRSRSASIASQVSIPSSSNEDNDDVDEDDDTDEDDGIERDIDTDEYEKDYVESSDEIDSETDEDDLDEGENGMTTDEEDVDNVSDSEAKLAELLNDIVTLTPKSTRPSQSRSPKTPVRKRPDLVQAPNSDPGPRPRNKSKPLRKKLQKLEESNIRLKDEQETLKRDRRATINGIQLSKENPSGNTCSNTIHFALISIMTKQLGERDRHNGWVYLLKDPQCPGHLKVGYSKDLSQRQKSHKDKCGWPLFPITNALPNTLYARRAETLVKADLAHLCVNRRCPKPKCTENHTEWFKVDEHTAEQVVDKWAKWTSLNPYADDGNLEHMWSWLVKTHYIPRRNFAMDDHDARWKHWERALKPPKKKLCVEYRKQFPEGEEEASEQYGETTVLPYRPRSRKSEGGGAALSPGRGVVWNEQKGNVNVNIMVVKNYHVY